MDSSVWYPRQTTGSAILDQPVRPVRSGSDRLLFHWFRALGSTDCEPVRISPQPRSHQPVLAPFRPANSQKGDRCI